MADARPYQSTSAPSVRAPVAAPPAARKELPPLTEAEHARIKATIADVKEFAPEVLPLIKGLHELGMIDGWRSVTIKKEK